MTLEAYASDAILGSMDTPIAIIFAGALIAAAILFTSHWQVSGTGQGHTVQLDRWTGAVYACGGGFGELSCR